MLSLVDPCISRVRISNQPFIASFIGNMAMAQENLYELNLSPADLQTLQTAVQSMVTVLAPHLISLSAGQRRELAKMGDKSFAFVRKAREYAENHPELVPGFLDLRMYDADLQGVDVLSGLMRTLQPLVDNVGDSLLLSGSEAYQAALVFYRSVRAAAQSGQLSAKTIYEDLSARFPQNGRAKAVKPATA